MEKTGTSTLQRFLADNRGKLRNEGVVYPRVGAGENGGSQWGFVASVCEEPWARDIGRFLNIRNEPDLRAYRAGLVRGLLAEFDAARGEVLVISSEHFQSRLRKREELEALQSFLSQWVERFEVVLYLRRQDRVAVSLLSTQVKSGSVAPKAFPSFKPKALPYYFDYESLWQTWAAVFGDDCVTVRLFDKRELLGGDLLTDFAATCGLQLPGKLLPEVENQSLSQAGLNFLIEVNRQLPDAADGTPNPLREKLAQQVSSACPGKTTHISSEEAQGFYQHFRESNERLKAAVLPQREQPLFDEDFDDYPAVASVQPSSHEDAVRVAIALMQQQS